LSATDDLVRNNAEYVRTFDSGEANARPAKKIAVLTCMDARLDPAQALGLGQGDAHVIRNAGGVVTDDAIRSLAISQHLLGTEEIVVIQHTNCGMQTITDEELAEKLEAHAGERPQWRAQAFSDLEQSVRASVKSLKNTRFLLNTEQVRGFVYEVETGKLREVSL
jgi:carbonic anhydrase